MIITRANDRRLRLSATDWVKNGDRWTITHVDRSGGLTVRHSRSQLNCQLPADYVKSLNRARVRHHYSQCARRLRRHHDGLLTGQESRQQLYTMLTRGRHANHLYLQVVGDGEPHALIGPDTISPHTPTEILQQILARDEAPVSATTLLRRLSDPAARLFDAVQRYTDGLKVAAEQLLGPKIVHTLDGLAEQVIPELTSEPSWPSLRAHLLALGAETGEHPLIHLHEAARGKISARPKTWPLYSTGASQSPHPLTQDRYGGFPAFRQTLHDHHIWGEYLAKRSQLVIGLAEQIRDCASQNSEQPVWAPPGSHPTAALLGEVEVWRAAVGIDPQDRRPTGAGQLQAVAALWQQNLDREVALCGQRVGADEGNARLVDPLKITSAKIDIACLQHVLFVRGARPGRACERQCQLKECADQRWREAPIRWRG